jgi:DNA polymerase I-like protein with 3'-5' exonuclease and polymerase domains
LESGDVYRADAIDWFSMDVPHDIDKDDPKMKKPRKAAKILHLGSQYAAGIKTVWSQALRQDRGIPFSLARTLNEKFKQTYAKTVAYWHAEMERVMASGYSEGRVLRGRRYYPRPPDLSEVANYPIQRTAAEIVNLEMIELDRQLKKHVPSAKLIIQLHDAFDVDTPKRHAAQVRRILQDVMSSPHEIDGEEFTFPVDIKEGTLWSEV